MTRPLTEGPKKGGRNPVRENFVRPNPPPAIKAKQMSTPNQAQIEAALDAIGPSYLGAADMKAAITAAAEVGEHTYTQSQLDDVVKRTWSATIERCARVAEGYANDAFHGEMIAAAIRAMKDKP